MFPGALNHGKTWLELQKQGQNTLFSPQCGFIADVVSLMQGFVSNDDD